jgi:ubiquinone biosynthesis protein Coq4
MMNDFLQKARAMRSVLKRTRGSTDLPSPVLYVEWLSGEMKRKVLDVEGKEHFLPDAVVQSNYRLVTGSQAKDLIAEHWDKLNASA